MSDVRPSWRWHCLGGCTEGFRTHELRLTRPSSHVQRTQNGVCHTKGNQCPTSNRRTIAKGVARPLLIVRNLPRRQVVLQERPAETVHLRRLQRNKTRLRNQRSVTVVLRRSRPAHPEKGRVMDAGVGAGATVRERTNLRTRTIAEELDKTRKIATPRGRAAARSVADAVVAAVVEAEAGTAHRPSR